MDKAYLRQVLLDEVEDLKNQPEFIPRIVDLDPHIRSSDISVITGVRRCGKSTLLRQIQQALPEHHLLYIDLESPKLNTFRLQDFELCDSIWSEQRHRKQKKNSETPLHI